MSDLISRSKAISILKQLNEHSLTGKMDISNAIYLLENQPTAYDIDKVVEELEKIRAKKTCDKEKCDTKELCRICVVDDAIEIVKQGVVTDDVCEWKAIGANDNWSTSCDKNSTHNVFGVAWFKRCPYCGRKLKIVGE